MEVVSWHCREEMVFDLIIEVCPPAGEYDVSADRYVMATA